MIIVFCIEFFLCFLSLGFLKFMSIKHDFLYIGAHFLSIELFLSFWLQKSTFIQCFLRIFLRNQRICFLRYFFLRGFLIENSIEYMFINILKAFFRGFWLKILNFFTKNIVLTRKNKSFLVTFLKNCRFFE